MKKLLISIIAIAMAQLTGAQKYVTVVDSGDKSPVEGATVISNNGVILGITDKAGKIKVNSDKDFPLEIRSLGFETETANQGADTVTLIPAVYSLSEITVEPGTRPIIKLTSYAREYCSGITASDTLQLYADYMMVSYYADGKVKGYKSGDRTPAIRSARRVARTSNAHGLDSIWKPGKDDDITFLSFREILPDLPTTGIEETEAMKRGASTDTIMGKYSPKYFYKKSDNLFTVSMDALGDQEGHKWSPFLFKLIGMTLEMDQLQGAYAYAPKEDGRYGLKSFIYSTGALHGKAKGKMFKFILNTKSELDLDCYTELYLTDVEFLTPEEYKEEKKEKAPIPFATPENLQPLPSAVVRLLERVQFP